MQSAHVLQETIIEKGLQFIRRKNNDGPIYFINNRSDKIVDDWIPLKADANSAALFEPMFGKTGLAKWRKKNEGIEVLLQLHPYESVIVQTYTAKKSVQGYTKTNSKYKLTARNYKGKKVNVNIAKGIKLSKANKTWYKGKFKYTDYKKVGKKWKKYTKTATVYVHYKNVKTTSKKVYTWTKQTKTADGYFNLQPNANYSTNEIRKDIHWRQVGTRIDTVTNYRTEMQDVYETQIVKEPYTYIEKEEYTYTEKEEYTYTTQEPIYEEVKVENTTQVKYQSIVNSYGQYRLTESELYQLFDMTGVKYSIVNGYDKSRYVNGFSTVNGVTTAYQFTPSTLVKLVLFEDNSAINLSYLTTVYGEKYADVKINEGNYTVE